MCTLKMATSGCSSSGPGVHLSIRVQSGPHCLLTKIFFTLLDITFGDLFLRMLQDHRIGEQSTVNKVIMSDQPRNGGVEVELGAPVALCVEFSSKYVTFFVSENSTSTPLVQPANVDVFRLLMSALCRQCRNAGKEAKTRAPNNMAPCAKRRTLN